ncbi:MAG: serine/threonine-protein kinase RsbW [Actinomycetota bacterium]|nr:serine/threonine-protein kinase RsbW [Actinomycetota bacterium]
METSTPRTPDPDDHASPRATRLPARPDAVSRARRAVRRAATTAGMAEDRVDDLVLAVSEACTNAMEAHVASGATEAIEVTCERVGAMFEVRVRDRGGGFRLEHLAPRPPLADPRHLEVERGWGVQLMQHLVDEVTFDLTEPGTCVCLRNALAPS